MSVPSVFTQNNLQARLIKIRIVIKPVNPTLWQGLSVRASLNYYSLVFSLRIGPLSNDP
jgi:hypothetical protein